MSKVKKSSLKKYLQKHDLFKIINKKDTSKSRLNKGLSIFITNPIKHKEIEAPKITSFIKDKIDMKDCSIWFTSCFNCLKGEYCDNIGNDRYIEFVTDPGKRLLICYSKKFSNKRKDKSKFSRKFGFHLDFKFSYDGKFVKIIDIFNWTIDDPMLAMENLIRKAPVLPDHIKTKEELELEAIINIVKERIMKKRDKIHQLEDELNIFKADYC